MEGDVLTPVEIGSEDPSSAASEIDLDVEARELALLIIDYYKDWKTQ